MFTGFIEGRIYHKIGVLLENNFIKEGGSGVQAW